MFTYEFVDVPISNALNATKDDNIKKCEDIIKQ